MNRFLIFFTLLPILGCGSSIPPDSNPPNCPSGEAFKVRLDPNLDPKFYSSLEPALKEWSRATSNSFKFEMDSASSKNAFEACILNVVTDETSTSDDVDAEGLREWTHSADSSFAPIRGGILVVLSSQAKKHVDDLPWMYSLYLHEIGHVLGLEHDTSMEHESVMWPYVTVPGRIGCEDERRACVYWHCTPTCLGSGWIDPT